ncbi:non-ribosomal peptide synthetase [Chitinophaga rhizophila]|uniref:Amino acid adenylation domain-containing protein n=1 Tax=Chitinophaga rhizophila TaxID=2866212 RepID=A0ABS7G5Y7_9BACT|nr:non-ribosomal peptide synthetase [Chitinophaga rhizophila]MBW8683063.1 amino acid adenylation domain-containing protein [Chitinophaga rhizophila]
MSLEPKWIPASPQQEGIWFHAIQHRPSFWNIVRARFYQGNFDLQAFTSALNMVISQHATLRTQFSIHQEKLFQVIATTIPVSEVLHYNIVSGDLASSQQLVTDEVRRLSALELDLEKAPLFRFRVLHFSDGVVLIPVIHHLITDATSNQIFWKDLISHYNNYLTGESTIHAVPERQYYHFAADQDNFLTTQEYIHRKQYWLEKLAGELPMLNFRLYHNPSEAAIHFEELDLTESLVHEIKSFALRNRVVYSSVFLTAYIVLLHKYANQSDILIGNIINGRQNRINYGAMGLFADRQVLLSAISETETLGSLLQKTNTQLMEAFEKAVPFDDLRRDMNLISKTGLSTLFTATFNMMKVIERQLDFSGLRRDTTRKVGHELPADRQEDFSLYILDRINSVRIRLEWKADSILQQVGSFMLENYKAILLQLIQSKDTLLNELPLLTSREHKLLQQFNDTTGHYPTGATMVSLFDEQVARTPENIALSFQGISITYKVLQEKSRQLCAYLRQKGLHSGHMAGICVTTGINMVIAMLGVMRTGAAYVPIDPEYPADRIRFVVEDAALNVVLTENATQQKVNELLALPGSSLSVNLDEAAAEISATAPFVMASLATPEDIAYVIYTSGSTGKPKGVIVKHHTVVNTLAWAKDYYRLSPADTAIQFFSFAFDSSVTEIYSHLIAGARLLLFSKIDRKDVLLLARIMEEEKVTRLLTIPSIYGILLDEMEKRKLCIRMVTISGESVNTALVDKHYRIMPEVPIINEYGPTECSVCATSQQLASGQIVTIGTPITNMQVHIRHAQGYIQPIGVAGELCISGPGVTAGYLGRDELTNSKFIQFHNGEGRKYYKTGDLARWLPDGRIEFLGRIDEQVKVRGFRIELGEIEKVIVGSGYVEQAVVLPQQDSAGTTRLTGYVVPTNAFSKVALMTFLRETLPDYMIPGMLVTLDAIPLSPNGKVDKKALPAMHSSQLLTDERIVHPQSAIQEELVRIWQELLGVRAISVTDDFFELGGHSILAIRLHARISNELNGDISVADILNNPTVLMQEKVLSKNNKNNNTSIKAIPANLVLLSPAIGDASENLFLAPGYMGICSSYVPFAQAFSKSHNVYSFNMTGLLPGESPLLSIAAIASGQISAIKALQQKGPYWLAGHSFGGRVAYEMARQLEATGDKVGYLYLLDAVASPLSYQIDINDLADDICRSQGTTWSSIHVQCPSFPESLSEYSYDDIPVLLRQLQHIAGSVLHEQAAAIASALSLALVNISMPSGVTGQITAPAVLAKAQDGIQRSNKAFDFGWLPYIPQLEIIHSPGDHTSIVADSKEAAKLFEQFRKIHGFSYI